MWAEGRYRLDNVYATKRQYIENERLKLSELTFMFISLVSSNAHKSDDDKIQNPEVNYCIELINELVRTWKVAVCAQYDVLFRNFTGGKEYNRQNLHSR